MTIFANMKFIMIPAAMLATLAVPAAATAPQAGDMLVEGKAEVRSAEISLAGIDLSSDAGAKLVAGQIRKAARDVCRENISDKFAMIREVRCERTARADGLAQMDRLRERGLEYAEAGAIRISR